MDRRFEPLLNFDAPKDSTEIHRVAVSVQKLRYFESNFIPAHSTRSWMSLLSDSDFHMYNSLEVLCMAYAKPLY